MGRSLPKRVIAKRKRLYSAAELAARLGVHENTIYNLEARPLPELLTDYLKAIGYVPAFYPLRKEDREGA